ncbi:MAG: hypothetical protein AABY11_01565, partial [archaeon]
RGRNLKEVIELQRALCERLFIEGKGMKTEFRKIKNQRTRIEYLLDEIMIRFHESDKRPRLQATRLNQFIHAAKLELDEYHRRIDGQELREVRQLLEKKEWNNIHAINHVRLERMGQRLAVKLNQIAARLMRERKEKFENDIIGVSYEWAIQCLKRPENQVYLAQAVIRRAREIDSK